MTGVQYFGDPTNRVEVGDGSAVTVVEALASSLAGAARHNPNDTDPPAAVLWSDPNAIWQPVIPHLRRLMPQLLVLGAFDPELRTGPAIWLRCMIGTNPGASPYSRRCNADHLPFPP